jgi:hypothetical protein
MQKSKHENVDEAADELPPAGAVSERSGDQDVVHDSQAFTTRAQSETARDQEGISPTSGGQRPKHTDEKVGGAATGPLDPNGPKRTTL